MSKKGITAEKLLENTTRVKAAAQEAGAKLQAAICDCGAGNYGHQQALQKLLAEDPVNAVIPIYDTGHMCRNILANLRKGGEYFRNGILFFLLRLNHGAHAN